MNVIYQLMRRPNISYLAFVLLLLASACLQLAGQTPFPLRAYYAAPFDDPKAMRQRYYQDQKGDLDPYVGRWKAKTEEGEQIQLQIYKIRQYLKAMSVRMSWPWTFG